MAAELTAGYVLTGGRSVRMGRNKATLPWHGGTLAGAIARQVESAAGSVTLVGTAADPGLQIVPDLYPGFGPVGGIATALSHSEAEWNLIVACDMPGLTSEWLRNLIRQRSGQVTVPQSTDGRLHGLCAVWHRSARKEVLAAVREGIPRVRTVLQRLKLQIVSAEDERSVANVNTPDEWAHFAGTQR